uniref:Uncharacterized protein n=1 Tax=Anguilla anguilla TaxID=7936 RepID=A0A0E9TZ05_ANGAN
MPLSAFLQQKKQKTKNKKIPIWPVIKQATLTRQIAIDLFV